MAVTVASRIRSRLSERRSFAEAQSVAKPRVVYCRRNNATKRELAHSDASGFYPPEFIKNRTYNWTDGHAILDCTLPRQVALKWLWIELATGPDANSVQLFFNNVMILKREFNGRLRLRLRLPDHAPSNHFNIQIDSGVFVPAYTLDSKHDERTLGVLVSEIRVAKHWWRNIDIECVAKRVTRLGKLFTGKSKA